MKIKPLFCTLAALAFLSAAFAQSVKIAPKKVAYIHKGKNIPKEKRTFTVTYPVVSGTISSAVKKNLENTISYWRVFETTLTENSDDYSLDEFSYKINYNKNGILDIALTREGVGAYPYSETVDLIVDLKIGKQVKITDVIKPDALATLAKMVDKKLLEEKRKITRRVDEGKFDDMANDKEAAAGIRADLKEQLNELRFTENNFDEFSVNDKGITFLYDAGFAHVYQAAQPVGRYFFAWAKLKPFIRRGSLLGRFIR